MITILHGDDTTASRRHLQSLIDEAVRVSHSITRITATTTKPAVILDTLGTGSLFAEPGITIIEEVVALCKTNTSVLEAILTRAKTEPVIIWEKKALTAAALKAFASLQPPARVQEFKPAPTLFAWLDSLSPRVPKQKQVLLLEAALAQSEPGLCFAMVQRHVRMMLEARSGAPVSGHPFQVKKITAQSTHFSLDQLQALHTDLLEIDLRQKTSSDYLSLSQELALLSIRL